MSEREGPITPSAEPSSPVVVTEVSPAAVETLVAAAAAAPAVAGPLALSPAATDAIVAAAVASTPPKVPATPAQEAETQVLTAGQRRTSLLWEGTQSLIAFLVTVVTLWVAAHLALLKVDTAVVLLSNAFFMILGLYFGRSNSHAIGGPKSEKER